MKGGSWLIIARAFSGVIRLLLGAKMNPRISTPFERTMEASSRLVMPQTLTFTIAFIRCIHQFPQCF